MTFPAIETLVPHRGPMLWVDEVIGRGDDRVRTLLTIRPDHVFLTDGRVEALICVEWMAQTVAALVGLRDRDDGEATPRPGYLIAIPEAHFLVPHFSVGDAVEIEVNRIWGDDELASFKCEVQRDHVPCATAQVSVYRKGRVGSTAP